MPKYPGLNTHKRVLDSADKVHGTTIHYVTSELIAGQLSDKSRLAEPNDDENTLMERIKKIENLIYPEEISKLKYKVYFIVIFHRLYFC